MNIVSASALAGLAALMTIDVSPKASPTVAAPSPQVFLEARAVLVAVAGTCETRSDVSEPLLGVSPAPSEDPAPGISSSDGLHLESVAVASAPERAQTDSPMGGTCGSRVPSTENVADDVATPTGAPDKATPVASVSIDPGAALGEMTPAAKLEAAPAAAPRAKRKSSPASKLKSESVHQLPNEASIAWWPTRKPDTLNVVFVGEAAFGSAISLLTDGQFESAQSANAHIEVRSAGGALVGRQWQIATNPRMLLMLVEPGVYTVSIEPDFSDANGRRMGTAASGQVYVR